ncbi:MAG: 4-hydroxy-tetrahydrodipicolinate synthase, partial [Oscillospiraceae bacterium]|nr:4-hydroxy-tetrahydrodipicolinate synthase [Oscillospiraceae bacterium]
MRPGLHHQKVIIRKEHFLKNPVFEGACTAIITPFCADGIDYPSLSRQIDFQIENGIDAITVAGTTGENATLEIHEYAQLVDFSINKCKGKVKVIVGIGGNNTSSCLKKGKIAKESGADALLMTPPYYNKCSASGLRAHFFKIADSIDLPLILYNVPSRTVVGIDIECYKSLSRHPNINGTKEASGNLSLISKITCHCGDDLNIWSGNDDNTIPLMSMGAKGVISVMSNLLPSEVKKICDLCLCRDYSAAFDIYKKYSALCEALFIDVNPIPIKAAMHLVKRDRGEMRLPLTPLDESRFEILKGEMKK